MTSWHGHENEYILHALKSNEVRTLGVRQMYYAYILYSLKDKKLYTGFTSDLKNRVKVHNYGGVLSTRNRRPLKLIFYEAFGAKLDAVRREKYFKTNSGKQTLRLMLRETLKINSK